MRCTEVETPTAKKLHRCDSCGEQIAPGEHYKRWRCYADGNDVEACTVKMHAECLAMHLADNDGPWEFMPFSYDRPAASTIQQASSGEASNG
jgi:predicted RNA-binding Zn-ribbon protein involved in translation (DUF1610 family)